MTSDGLNRIATLFSNDISTILYKVDTVQKEQAPLSKTVTDNSIDVVLSISSSENGNFTDFKIKGSTSIILTERNISFTKTSDGLLVRIPFNFVNVEE